MPLRSNSDFELSIGVANADGGGSKSLIKTFARVCIGFLLACLTAGLVTVLFVTTPAELMEIPAEAFPEKALQTLVWGLLTATHSALFAAAFALIATGIAEWMSIRSLPYYLLIGIGIALLGFTAQYSSEVSGQPTVLNNYALKAFATAGFFAGLVYWLTAGRVAGPARGSAADITWSKPAVPPRIVVKDTAKNDSAVATVTITTPKSSLGKRMSDVRARGDTIETTAKPSDVIDVARASKGGVGQRPSQPPKPR